MASTESEQDVMSLTKSNGCMTSNFRQAVDATTSGRIITWEGQGEELLDPAAAPGGSGRTLNRAAESFPVSLHRVRTSRFAFLRVAVVALGLLPATT